MGACVVVVWVLGMSVRSREPSATARLPAGESASRLQHVLEVGTLWGRRRRKTLEKKKADHLPETMPYGLPDSVRQAIDDVGEIEKQKRENEELEEIISMAQTRLDSTQRELVKLNGEYKNAATKKDLAYYTYLSKIKTAFDDWYGAQGGNDDGTKTAKLQLALSYALATLKQKYVAHYNEDQWQWWTDSVTYYFVNHPDKLPDFKTKLASGVVSTGGG